MIFLPEHVAKKILAEDAEKQRKQTEETHKENLRSRILSLRGECDSIKDDAARLRRVLSRLMQKPRHASSDSPERMAWRESAKLIGDVMFGDDWKPIEFETKT